MECKSLGAPVVSGLCSVLSGSGLSPGILTFNHFWGLCLFEALAGNGQYVDL